MVNELKKAVWGSALTLGLVGMAASSVEAQDAEVARKVTKRVTPVYSAIARQANLAGTVKLMLVVAPEGTVKTVRVLGGNPVLAIAAEQAVRQWKFEAAKTETNEPLSVKFEGPR